MRSGVKASQDLLEENVIYVFINASNVWEAIKTKGRFFDYEKIVRYIDSKFSATSIKIFYYSAYPAEGTRNYCLDDKHKFFTFLKKGLRFEVRKKELKRISVINKNGESIEEKGNMDVEITIDAMHHFKKYNVAIFFTGDSDFLALVSYLRNNGKKVYIFSSQNNISQELRTGADGYYDVLKLKEDIWGKELKYRSEIERK
ncbi:MAG TPA: NYN domain-containing protein [Candidatus Vogelbacteria bacterium]|nr:NYN domain-containing protein [Candidatus Vogelbacteria bacterium]